MKKIIFLLSLLCLANKSYALFCPMNFNQINVGDSIEQVEKLCGKPAEERKMENDENVPQEWTFLVHPEMKRYTQTRTNSGAEASVRMSVAFSEGKVVNITVNSMSLASTSVCGASVSVGDSLKSVKSACGDPYDMKKATQRNTPKPTERVEYLYNSTPPATLVFTNGVLQERK